MPKKQLVHLTVPTPMHLAVKRQAHRQNKTQSAIIREAISFWLMQYGDVTDPNVQWGGVRDGK